MRKNLNFIDDCVTKFGENINENLLNFRDVKNEVVKKFSSISKDNFVTFLFFVNLLHLGKNKKEC